jgi:hypothetical protein
VVTSDGPNEPNQEPDPVKKRQIALSATQGLVSILAVVGMTVAIVLFTEALLTTAPAGPLAPASTTTPEGGQYALMLGGIANVTTNMSIRLHLSSLSESGGPLLFSAVTVALDSSLRIRPGHKGRL